MTKKDVQDFLRSLSKNEVRNIDDIYRTYTDRYYKERIDTCKITQIIMECGGSFKSILNNLNYHITYPFMFADDIKADKIVDLNSVYEIAEGSFFHNLNIEEVEGKYTVVVNEWAFTSCKNLKKAYLPDLTTIGGAAFRACESLEEFTVPRGIQEIHPTAFEQCKNLILYIPQRFLDNNHSLVVDTIMPHVKKLEIY